VAQCTEVVAATGPAHVGLPVWRGQPESPPDLLELAFRYRGDTTLGICDELGNEGMRLARAPSGERVPQVVGTNAPLLDRPG
jgi:hypothetical protein